MSGRLFGSSLKGSVGLEWVGSRLRLGSSRAGGCSSVGQPSMADSPPQRIHALLSATPAGTTIARRWHRFGRYRSIAQEQRGRALAAGGRDKQNMDFARESGQEALTERIAIPGRQGVASVRSRTSSNCVQLPLNSWGPHSSGTAVELDRSRGRAGWAGRAAAVKNVRPSYFWSASPTAASMARHWPSASPPPPCARPGRDR